LIPAAPDYRPLFWIGPYQESLEVFDSISSKATSLIPDATRIAFAITVIRQTDSVREAVVRLRPLLPTVEINPDNDLDLIFQINRPITDGRGRFINRLARWDTLQVTSLRVVIGSIPGISPMQSQPPICAARIYADVSTDADNVIPISRAELAEIVSELRAYAINIVENGDRK